MKDSDKNIQRKYSISEYNQNWVNKFDSIKKFVLKVFGDKALQIEHVGSTSIPGMKAKPIIDILIIVKDVKDLSLETVKMIDAGYEWGENYIASDTLLFFKTGPASDKLENIHVCQINAPQARQFLVMRDFFRKFPKKAEQYANLKEANFLKYPDDYPAYRAAKASFLAQMEKEAYEWEEGS